MQMSAMLEVVLVFYFGMEWEYIGTSLYSSSVCLRVY